MMVSLENGLRMRLAWESVTVALLSVCVRLIIIIIMLNDFFMPLKCSFQDSDICYVTFT